MAGRQTNFQFISSFCQAKLSVEKYQSNKTGMKLYHINLPLPVIKLEICVQTKPYDDTGCPHTLEHLIFLGSRKYPQQGYLDHISAQHYSLGTNATTYRDMTTYELTTVNSQSLSTLLPVYLDHIFHPLLTNDCYLTEVHHISGETGDDAGVVYSEIQSSENQPDEILLFSILRDLWSEKSPYYYESGGRLESIRNELNLDKIKLFHRKNYQPNHVAIVLCGGGIHLEEILEIVTKFEDENFGQYDNRQKIAVGYVGDENQRKKTKFTNERFPSIQIKCTSVDENSISSETVNITNPMSIDTNRLSIRLTTNEGNESSFCDSEMMVSHEDLSIPSSSPSTSLLPTTEIDNSIFNEYKEVCYPVEDNEENLGQVAFGYRLESIYQMEVYTALDVLLTTLFDEDISIFYKEFIELPNTLCSSIDHDWFNYPERVLTITFEGVEVENLTLVADKYSSTLYSIINSPVDNEQLSVQLQRNIKKKIELHLNEIENDPYTYLTDLCCLDHISELSIEDQTSSVNDNEQHLHQFLQNKEYLEGLIDRPLSYWYELIRKYLLEWDSNKRTIILLKPSNELLVEQQEQEEQRLADRLQSLGSTGLEKFKSNLDQARSNNKQSSSACADLSDQAVQFHNQFHLPPIEFLPNDEQIDLFHTPTSEFNKYTLRIPIDDLPWDLQIYLPLFSNLLFHTAIEYNNHQFDKYHFCELITRDILAYSVANGQSSGSPIQSSYVHTHYMNTFTIHLQSISTNSIYRNTIDYMRYVLFGSILTDYKIILEECEKQLKNLIETLQDGQTIHQAYFNCLLHSNESKHSYHQMNIFQQKKFFEKICKQPSKCQHELISKLELIKTFLLKNLSRMHLTICGNMELVKENWSIIEEFIKESKEQSQREFQYHQIKDKQIVLQAPPATIIGTPHEESGYILRWARVSISPNDFVPLLIFSNYLDIENGPLWTACRTNGYAYGVAFDFDVESNLILLSINQCSQLTSAYSSAMETLKDLIENPSQIDLKRMHAARNLTICMLTEHLSTLGRAIGVCIRSYLNSYSIEKYQSLLNELHSFEFTKDILLKIMENYLRPIINEKQSETLILVNTNKMKETRAFLHHEQKISNVILIKDVVKHLSR